MNRAGSEWVEEVGHASDQSLGKQALFLCFSNQLIDFNYVYKCNETEPINERRKWHFATRQRRLWRLRCSLSLPYLTVPIVCQIQFLLLRCVLFDSLKESSCRWLCGQSSALSQLQQLPQTNWLTIDWLSWTDSKVVNDNHTKVMENESFI